MQTHTKKAHNEPIWPQYKIQYNILKQTKRQGLSLLPLKMDMPYKNYTWYKIMSMTFWRDWRSLTSLNSEPIVS
jgi:hypothetical protein